MTNRKKASFKIKSIFESNSDPLLSLLKALFYLLIHSLVKIKNNKCVVIIIQVLIVSENSLIASYATSVFLYTSFYQESYI